MTSDNKQQSVRFRIREFVRTRFPLAAKLDMKDDDSLLDRGVIDSLGILDLVSFFEESLSLEVQDEDLEPENFDSIDALVAYVEQRS